MTIWWLLLILGTILAFGTAFIWIAIHLHASVKPQKSLVDSLQESAEEDVDHIFNEEFREELRNRGRLHFEKILGENAMFLQQDLRLTTSQMNEFMKGEITKELKAAFANYENAISSAKELAVESIEKTKTTIDQERQALVTQLAKEVGEEKDRRVKQFEERMGQVINHYVLEAIGSQIDLNDQLEYILSEMEAHKAAIIEDIRSGT